MTKDKAYKVAAALNDIDDFEIFMDEIHNIFRNVEGNFEDFYYNELFPLLEKEMERRKAVLEDM